MTSHDRSEPAIERRGRLLWTGSVVLTLGLVVVLGAQWAATNRADVPTGQLTTDDEVEGYLAAGNWVDRNLPDAATLPTGVFIQSLKFESATDVHMTGFVWGSYDPDAGVEEGFTFPEQVDSSSTHTEEWRVAQNGVESVGWHFEGTFRQPFAYDTYPFDHKTVWLRIWPHSFDANLVLTPDLDAYTATGAEDTFGIEESIVLGDWVREDTYFDYAQTSYTTNFGIDGYVGQTDFPELRFNIELRRNFENAFIVNLVPLLVVAALAFGAVLTVTPNQKRAGLYGFSISGVIGTVSALFFVVLLSHIQLREQFAGAGIVYLEYFYFLTYITLLVVAINTYTVSHSQPGSGLLATYGDNMVVRLLYWPALLSGAVVITAIAL